MGYDSNGNWTLTPGYLAIAGQVIQPSQHNPVLEDIGLNGLSAVVVRDGRAAMTGNLNMGAFRVRNISDGALATDAVSKAQLDALAATLSTSSRGDIYGLTLSNNGADATNDIDIAAGSAASNAASPYLLTLASALTKRLDAAWAVGTNQGGLDTGAIANTTYHIWLMQRSDTGIVDVCFSASSSAPTTGGSIPAAYDRFRRIGSILREGAAIVAFKQDGNIFRRATKVDRSSTSAVASALLALSVPLGINVYPILAVDLSTGNVSTDGQVLFGGAWEGSAGIVIARVFTTSLANVTSLAHDIVSPVFLSNTSAQIYFATTISSGSLSANVLSTIGWIDTRGTI